MVHGVLQLNLLGQRIGDPFLCWRLASIYGWKVRFYGISLIQPQLTGF
jgi:hypothetical protein